jgi:hypothetical protein
MKLVSKKKKKKKKKLHDFPVFNAVVLKIKFHKI